MCVCVCVCTVSAVCPATRFAESCLKLTLGGASRNGSAFDLTFRATPLRAARGATGAKAEADAQSAVHGAARRFFYCTSVVSSCGCRCRPHLDKK